MNTVSFTLIIWCNESLFLITLNSLFTDSLHFFSVFTHGFIQFFFNVMNRIKIIIKVWLGLIIDFQTIVILWTMIILLRYIWDWKIIIWFYNLIWFATLLIFTIACKVQCLCCLILYCWHCSCSFGYILLILTFFVTYV